MPFLLLFSFIITGVLKAELITIKALLVSGLENNNHSLQIYPGFCRHCGNEMSNANIN